VRAWQQLGCSQAPSLLQLLAGSAELLDALAGGPQGGARAGQQEVLQVAAQAAASVGLQLLDEEQQQQTEVGGKEAAAAAAEASEEQLQAVSAALCSHFGVRRVELLGHGGTAALLAACREQRTQPSHSVIAAAALAAGSASQQAAAVADDWGPGGPAAAALAALEAAPELSDLALWCGWEQRFQPSLGPLEEFLAREGGWMVCLVVCLAAVLQPLLGWVAEPCGARGLNSSGQGQRCTA
jgi:hypothetical protein